MPPCATPKNRTNESFIYRERLINSECFSIRRLPLSSAPNRKKPLRFSVILQAEYHAKRCLPLRASDVDFVSDVHCGSDVVPSAQWANITSLRASARNIIMSIANNITFATAKTSLAYQKATTKTVVANFILPLILQTLSCGFFHSS